MIARYPGVCAATGRPIRPGDPIRYDPATRAAALIDPPDLADLHDQHMPRHGLGRSRAGVWRSLTSARHGQHLDHEVE